jgi:hypothetical protein
MPLLSFAGACMALLLVTHLFSLVVSCGVVLCVMNDKATRFKTLDIRKKMMSHWISLIDMCRALCPERNTKGCMFEK